MLFSGIFARFFVANRRFRRTVPGIACLRGKITRPQAVARASPSWNTFRIVRLLKGSGVRRMLAGLSRALVFALAIAPAAAQAQQLEKVTFATNWVAEAEHGGFYQALADGTYRKAGLDVTVLPGGPNVNHRLQLLAGKIQFYMSANSIQAFDAVSQNIPTLVVASMFQKDPQVLLAHPDQGIEKFEDLKKLTLFVSNEGVASYFQWMKRDFGFNEQQVKPYTFNPQPFLADKKSAMQGYVTSEPYAVEKAGKFKPKIFLLADLGFGSYSTLIETRRDMIEQKPDVVQRFVNASITGWYNYLYGDNSAANARIKRDNPEMSDELIAYSIAKMKEYGIVDSGDSLKLGIGAMTDERMKSFFDKMVAVGVVKGNIDYKKAYTLRFVNKGVGVDLRPKN
jgi:NitT/TauT family transport system substrate-binding protein